MVLDFGLGLGGDNLFAASDAAGEGFAPIVNQIVWKDVGIGIVPIGSVVAWFKTLAGAPPLLPNYVECNGQVLDDGDSPLNGATIPDLNGSAGTQMFLRGHTASGGVGGTETHVHAVNITREIRDDGGDGTYARSGSLTNTGYAYTLPTYTECVWIMRIK